MRKYATTALVFFVVVTAVAAVLSSNRPEAGPYGTVELTEKEARPAGLIEDLLRALQPPPPAGPPPTAAPPGYEPVGPGDRTAAGDPSFLRKTMGTFDGGAPGLFASFCDYTHSLPDDPIVYPGQPGASHLHDFFGATGTDAYSTDDSLRGTETTCNYPGDSASYWVPALYEDGVRVMADIVGAYYRAGNKAHRYIEPFPTGLKMLVKDTSNWRWYCVSNDAPISYSMTSPSCPAGEHLGLEINFPDCWDGRYLDVPDHKSHMAFALAEGGCPASHPVFVPKLTYFVNYAPTRGAGQLLLAPLDNPSPVHADFLNSWNQAQQAKFVRDCIKAHVYCGSTPPP